MPESPAQQRSVTDRCPVRADFRQCRLPHGHDRAHDYEPGQSAAAMTRPTDTRPQGPDAEREAVARALCADDRTSPQYWDAYTPMATAALDALVPYRQAETDSARAAGLKESAGTLVHLLAEVLRFAHTLGDEQEHAALMALADRHRRAALCRTGERS